MSGLTWKEVRNAGLIEKVKIDCMAARRTFDGQVSLGRPADSGMWIVSIEPFGTDATELILTDAQAQALSALLGARP